MARQLHKLTPVKLKSLRPGKYEDGGGLRLVVRDNGSQTWVYRFSVHGRRREMGLGPFPDVTIKEARDLAAQARQLVRQGHDPITHRQTERRNARRNLHLLRDVALDCFEARKAELKGDGVAGRWFSPLEIHILPKLGAVPVAELDQNAIRDALAPIWHEKAETARKAANRLNLVLKHAGAMGLSVDLQAVEKARLLLGKQRHEAKQIEALPWREVPAFYETLGSSVTELALRLLILAGVRSAAVRLATPGEFDLVKQIWTVPAAHMKGLRGATQDFRVPLSDEAVAVVREALRHGGSVVFPGRKGQPIAA